MCSCARELIFKFLKSHVPPTGPPRSDDGPILTRNKLNFLYFDLVRDESSMYSINAHFCHNQIHCSYMELWVE